MDYANILVLNLFEDFFHQKSYSQYVYGLYIIGGSSPLVGPCK